MRIKYLLCSALLFCLAWAPPADAKRPTAKGSKSTVSTKKAAGKAKAKTKKRATRNRRASRPPRQSAPTPERYREIQQALTDKGFEAGPVDGAWGPEWVDALKRFQGDRNLSVDGKLGSLSLIALGLGPKREEASNLIAKPEPDPIE